MPTNIGKPVSEISDTELEDVLSCTMSPETICPLPVPQHASIISSTSPPPAPTPQMLPQQVDAAGALLQMDWEVQGVLLLTSGEPLFRLRVSPVAWDLADMARFDMEAAKNACRYFKGWGRFFTTQVSPSQPLPYCPRELVPGDFVDFRVSEMLLWNKKWVVIGFLEVVLSDEEIKSHETILTSVARALENWDGSEIDV